MTTKPDQIPPDLTGRAGILWAAVLADYELAPAELELLAEACRALDRADQARESIAALGVVVSDRYGSPKTTPAVDIEARARQFYAQAIRQLDVKLTAAELSRREANRRGKR